MTKLFRPTFTFIAGLLFLVFMLSLGVKNLYLGEGNMIHGSIAVFILAAGIALKFYSNMRS